MCLVLDLEPRVLELRFGLSPKEEEDADSQAADVGVAHLEASVLRCFEALHVGVGKSSHVGCCGGRGRAAENGKYLRSITYRDEVSDRNGVECSIDRASRARRQTVHHLETQDSPFVSELQASEILTKIWRNTRCVCATEAEASSAKNARSGLFSEISTAETQQFHNQVCFCYVFRAERDPEDASYGAP
jgi:hypothetical protein